MRLNIIRMPDYLYAETETGWVSLHKDSNGNWTAHNLEISALLTSEGLQIVVNSSDSPLKTLQFRWKASDHVRLSFLGDHWERGYGDLEWRGLVPERVMPWYFMTYDGSITEGYGVKTGAGAMCFWQADAESVSLTADIRCGMDGVILSGRTLEVCTVVCCQGQEQESPFAVTRRFCRIMCGQPVLPSQPVYGGNNWYYAYGNSSHTKILEDSRFISSLASSVTNRPYMVIDDGWQLCSGGGVCNGGPWTGNYLFPDMQKLAGEMKEVGVKPGIWCRPLLLHNNVPEHWRRYTSNGVVLDPSVPDVLDYVEESIRSMVGWGYDLIKHDFTTYDILGKWGFQMGRNTTNLSHAFMDRSKTTAEIITNLYRRIAKASQKSLIIGCNTIGHLAAGLFEIQRTGDDTSGRVWERTRRMGINTLAFRMAQHETFFSHDADCVGLTEHVPWELNRQWMELLAESGTPLFISAEPASVTKEQAAAIRNAFEIAAQSIEPCEPLDWLTTMCPTRWKLNNRIAEFQWTDLRPQPLNRKDNIWWQ